VLSCYCLIINSDIKPGQWAVFPGGAGGVGIQGVQIASILGIRTIVVDTGDEKKELALSLGAEHFIDFKETDPVSKVLEITRGGAHVVFVTGKEHTNFTEVGC
jgi:propanol-preferring alcohol dehydrogenase